MVDLFSVDLLVWKWQSRVPRKIWFLVRCNINFTLELIFMSHMLEKENILVDMREQVCLAGIEKLMMELSF